ncbi:MAG: phosphatidylglycerophosphatase A [Bdellovibrio sp. CG12_big_fil_rev_8_21_14_0_65_39_13]|nr:MAG: phosphatidylglycerophosphatase A [Bdellovibrio sp. CG22_combo_CG10-13_8_21_14_all_39_27]PIQ60876.1 MAG: phosphatidylglycerophosphatase A [Bdellovibrio sp. CG12_big_fil_rev_8_21_14_0_65_39_13]PIR36500.1 MAG: phosphatidylglycerophosphatase A [Bdellovibrio sp. CG11_big_fil_rev_8_21_14_0_20_39_38]
MSNVENAPHIKDPSVLFCSFFGVGFIKWAPGTFGTLAAMPFLYLLGLLSPPFFLFIPFITVATVLSCFIADHVQKKYQLHDPGWIVIDEVLGIAVTWLFIAGYTWLDYLLIFAFFRFFDIVKIWPASYFDKKVKHGAGTIIDDIISGVFAGLTYLGVHHFLA